MWNFVKIIFNGRLMNSTENSLCFNKTAFYRQVQKGNNKKEYYNQFPTAPKQNTLINNKGKHSTVDPCLVVMLLVK